MLIVTISYKCRLETGPHHDNDPDTLWGKFLAGYPLLWKEPRYGTGMEHFLKAVVA